MNDKMKNEKKSLYKIYFSVIIVIIVIIVIDTDIKTKKEGNDDFENVIQKRHFI
jgi:hypothetical protein